MFKKNVSKKMYYTFSGSLILFVVILAILGIILNFYPGGYSIQNENTEKLTIVKKVLVQEERFVLELTSENELKIALLKYNINRLVSLWFTGLFLIVALIISLVFAYKNKLEKYFFLLLIALLIILPLDIYVILHHLNNIDNGIEFLKR